MRQVDKEKGKVCASVCASEPKETREKKFYMTETPSLHEDRTINVALFGTATSI